jgi:hypothetical protein
LKPDGCRRFGVPKLRRTEGLEHDLSRMVSVRGCSRRALDIDPLVVAGPPKYRYVCTR